MTHATAFAEPLTARIAVFIREVGLRVEPATLDDATLLPGVTVRGGAILVDPSRLAHPGDLLHEAGHLAVTEAARRATLAAVGDEPGEEMAAIAWSYAAARHLGLDPAIVFHAAGYRGGAQAILTAFETGEAFGTPLLEWWGMTLGRKSAAARGEPPFPHMRRWLR
ncbi:MAG TPA: hypothetical protein VMT68_08875 [Caulobacteraceae bacterium]|nr:hypothetical protein [Caulobacteraceae bacterium]